jgi:small-conductance mechanosensitive channel
VKDAKKAKRSARSAYKNAKTSRSADSNVISQEKKIAKLTAELKRKEERLQELNFMRTAIYSKMPAPPSY